MSNNKKTISSYTTLRSANQMDYPYVEAINSALGFSDEVIVLDSTMPNEDDGTFDTITKLAKKDNRIKVYHENINWHAPNHGIFDGATKAKSRSYCTGDVCIQFDSDECFHESQIQLMKDFVNFMPLSEEKPLYALPIIEFWSALGPVRIDINLWKWRVSLNHPNITHGIPLALRQYDKASGLLYSKPGSDSCDYVYKDTLMPVPCVGFTTEYNERIRLAAIKNKEFVPEVQEWFNNVVTRMPSVYHYSWWKIERKIKQYKLFWTDFWQAMYNEKRDERNNPFFPGKLFSEVSDEEIKMYANILETQTCGHIFHCAWNWKRNNGIIVNQSHPIYIQGWLKKHE